MTVGEANSWGSQSKSLLSWCLQRLRSEGVAHAAGPTRAVQCPARGGPYTIASQLRQC